MKTSLFQPIGHFGGVFDESLVEELRELALPVRGWRGSLPFDAIHGSLGYVFKLPPLWKFH
jgi:hypothetical protein